MPLRLRTRSFVCNENAQVRMKKPLFNIPARSASGVTEIDVREKPLSSWIEALPLMDYEYSCEQVTGVLSHINRHQIEVVQRFKAMTLLSNRVDKLHKLTPRNFDNDSLPLSDKQLESKQRPLSLLSECAIGHKIVVADLVENRKLLAKHKKALFLSIVKAMHYMSLELVERFLSYRLPLDGTWQDFHKLYAISEQMGILNIATSGTAVKGEASITISGLYKKILLLSLADFSRLMNGEAEKLYKQLATWSTFTSLSPLDDNFREGIVVDLGIDAPANHLFSEKPLKFINGRLFDISRLLTFMDEQIDRLTEQGQKGSNMLSARAKQAMYIRLRFTWGTRCERGAARDSINKPVKLISGLHDCHRGLSADAHFNPEHDELRLDPEWNSTDDTVQRVDELSLVPEDENPWIKDEIEARVASNFSSRRISQFDQQTKQDAWEKIYANQMAEMGRLQRESAPLTVTDCLQVDTSSGGMAIVCSGDQIGASLAVGKVVAVADNDKEGRWQTGVVRWLVMSLNSDIRCGIQILSDCAETIATRSIKGAGENSEYLRALMIPAEGDYPASVIVPAVVYSTNTVLSVVTQKALKYIVLTELLNNSSSYNQFSFEEIDKPAMGINLKAKIDHDRRSL